MFELSRYFSHEEIKMVDDSEQFNGHPVKAFFQFKHTASSINDVYGYVYENIMRGIRLASAHNNDWYEGVKQRLLQLDHANASSALSELRAYGCLKADSHNFDIEPNQPQKHFSPDFTISRLSEQIIIESFCKRINDKMLERMRSFEKEESVNGFKAISVMPFGIPKYKKENVTENVIHSLTQIKQNENQASDVLYSILWIDMQDDSLQYLIEPSSALPLRSWNGNFYSGELWYSCYGEKGLPILEDEHYAESIKMQHDGRFSKKGSAYDCFAFSLPNATLLFENPYSQKTVSDHFRYWLFSRPWFRLEYSWLRFPNDDLQERIELEKVRIFSLCTFIDSLQ